MTKTGFIPSNYPLISSIISSCVVAHAGFISLTSGTESE